MANKKTKKNKGKTLKTASAEVTATKPLLGEYIRLTYPITLLFPAIIFVVISFISTKSIFLNAPLVAGTLLAVIWTSIANVINQSADYEIDKINFHATPIVNKTITPTNANLFLIAQIATSFLLALYLRNLVPLLNIAALIVGLAYSVEPIRLKKRTFLSHATIAFGYSILVPVMAYEVFAKAQNFNPYLIGILFLSAYGMSMQKDYRDIAGDGWRGAKTFLVTFGKQWGGILHFLILLLPFVFLINFIEGSTSDFTSAHYIFLFGAPPVFYSYFYAVKNIETDKIRNAYPLMIVSASFCALLLAAAYFI